MYCSLARVTPIRFVSTKRWSGMGECVHYLPRRSHTRSMAGRDLGFASTSSSVASMGRLVSTLTCGNKDKAPKTRTHTLVHGGQRHVKTKTHKGYQQQHGGWKESNECKKNRRGAPAPVARPRQHTSQMPSSKQDHGTMGSPPLPLSPSSPEPRPRWVWDTGWEQCVVNARWCRRTRAAEDFKMGGSSTALG